MQATKTQSNRHLKKFKKHATISWLMVFFQLRSRLEHYFAFTGKEVRDLAVAIVITGFVFSFRDWGEVQADVFLGLRNFVLATLIAAIAFFAHESVHRIFALMIGFKSEFKIWWGGLVASLVIAFASNGVVQLILPGGIVNSLIMRHRLGEFRYGLNYWENGLIALYGPLANLALAFIAKLFLVLFPSSWFFQKMLFLNVVFAICAMLPLPALDGINTFFAGRVLYIFSFFGILSAGVLIYFTNITLALIGGLLIMLIAGFIYYTAFETAGGGGGH